MEWEPKLRTRYVGLLMNVLGYRFRDDIPTKLAAFERTVPRLREPVHKDGRRRHQGGSDDVGDGDMRMKEHLIRNSARITSWNQMREEILEITRTQQYIDSQPMPMQFGANPKSKGKGKESMQRQRQGTSMGKTRPRMLRTNRPRKQSATIRESASTATSQAT